MSGNYGKTARNSTMRHRNTGRGRNCYSAADTRNNSEAYSSFSEKGGFLPSPAENEGVPALQPNHSPPQECVHGQKLIDAVLRERMVVRFLSDIDLLGIGWSFLQ